MIRLLFLAFCIVSLSLLSVGCKTVEEKPDTSSNEVSIEIPEFHEEPADVQALRERIFSIATGSECAKLKHSNRGAPKKGYLKGVSLTYVKAVCDYSQEWVKIASQPVGDKKVDAMAVYGLNLSSPNDRLDTLFSLIIGSAARESSFKWCSGIDESASNYNSETCEAGAYQTSYNSRSANPELKKLYEKYKSSSDGCFQNEYSEGVTCSASSLKNWGTGEGVTFQKLSKECTGFATEYHAVMLRVRMAHYGPIKNKHAEIKPQCTSMFQEIRKAVSKDPSLCMAVK